MSTEAPIQDEESLVKSKSKLSRRKKKRRVGDIDRHPRLFINSNYPMIGRSVVYASEFDLALHQQVAGPPAPGNYDFNSR
jgi:hypothetical protein